MIRTHLLPCHLPDEQCRRLNQESGRIFTATLVHHWRLYRHPAKVWLSPLKYDRVLKFFCGETFLHSHSYQAAQQDFYEACKTARELKKTNPSARYPYKRKFYHTTTWKHTAIKVVGGRMRLSLANGQPYVWLDLPDHLVSLPSEAFRQVQLCYSHATQTNTWHLTIDDKAEVQPTTNTGIMAVDMGEIHPAACTNGQTSTIVTCRVLRANAQHRNKKTADLQEQIARCTRGSRRWRKLTQSRKKLQAQCDNRQRDMLHKVSHAVIEEAEAMGAGTIVIGDVRNVSDKTRVGETAADGTVVKKPNRLSREVRQKIANWPHGQLRAAITYKAAAKGMAVEIINEAYTSKTCPKCGHLNKPKGRNYRCSNPQCGFVGHRDNVGSTNILSKKKHGKLAQMLPPTDIKYRHPVRRVMRRPVDTRHVARASENPKPLSRPLERRLTGQEESPAL